ncbi:MAG TPA: GNAT family N-acetyltransferase, partial [Actinocrinis sp.]
SMRRVDSIELLGLFDRQLRREFRGDHPDDLVENTGRVMRHIATGDGGWCGVIWSDLDEQTADVEIAAQVEHFTALGREFEWKLYGHDRPADLGERLVKAGFRAEAREALMVAEVAGLPTEPVLPEGVRIEPVTDVTGVRLMFEAHDQAFGTPAPRLEREMLHRAEHSPETLTALVVLAGDRAICSARMEFSEGTDFASLWGGGTVPEWRGKGVYRATVAYRAALAAERGCRFLQVDASDDSRPILARLGFRNLSSTTPYNYEPR